MLPSIAKDLRRRAAILSGAGAFLAAALCAFGAESPPANIDWTKAQLVRVEMARSRFFPDKLAFRRGFPYHLRLENTGGDMHEFTAPEFFKAVSIRNPEALDAQRHEVVLQPKESRDVYFVPLKAGRYELTCADHEWDGMVGEITIE